MNPSSLPNTRHKAVWGFRRIGLLTLALALGVTFAAEAAGPHRTAAKHARAGMPSARVTSYKLDGELTRRSRTSNPIQTTSVIVTLPDGAALPARFAKFARANGRLGIISGQVLDVPNGVLAQLEADPGILQIHYNRPTATLNYRTSLTVGADIIRQNFGYTGAGIGVAVIDSGITTWHDDLTVDAGSARRFPYGNQRVAKFVDFVNSRTLPYDDNGHGSHVAGIIAGNGYDSKGQKAGIAPDASLVSLKVLDENGQGTISHIIAALDWVAANAKTYNIRVVNLSVGAPIRESYFTDPLTLAAKRLTDKGIVVVSAAGNLGKNANGQLQYGGITAPGNAPWVLTVGATSTQGTATRRDDTMADFSSSGPTYIDFSAKPDLVAPGTGTVSLAVPGSTLYAQDAQYLVAGSVKLGYKPYLSLTGTSMAAPVISGTVALMLQANPSLTPNLVKALLQYTAQEYRGYSPLREGAGFVNSLGAVQLAQFYARAKKGQRMPVQGSWSRHIIWGNHLLSGGYIKPTANAWGTGIVWGVAKTLADSGDNIVWGTADSGDNIVWGTADSGDNIVWGTADSGDNIVWGTDCGGDDCDNVVWGTADSGDNIVWGTADAGDNIVWGTADSGDNIVWGTADLGDNIVWGTSSNLQVLFPDDRIPELRDIAAEFGDITLPSVSPSKVGGGR